MNTETERTITDQFFDQVKCFHFRITHPDVTKEPVFEALSSKFRYVIVCQEISKKGNPHIHALVGGADENFFGSFNTKAQINDNVIDYLQTYADLVYGDDTWKGNKLKSVTHAISNEQLRRYVLKEGNFMYKGFTSCDISQSFNRSYVTAENRYTSLKQKLINNQITYRQYQTAYIQNKAEDGTINTLQLQNHFMAMRVLTGRLSIDTVIDYVEDRNNI